MLSATSDIRKERLTAWFSQLQARVCLLLEGFEDKHKFEHKRWNYEPGSGGGLSCILRGDVIEKAGVNTSCISGECSPSMMTQLALKPEGEQNPSFWAAGISVIVHPNNPFVPAIHLNTRCFILKDRHWFGGVMDLNPMVNERRSLQHPDTIFFHKQLASVCCQHYTPDVYEAYKAECDDYFQLKHRHLARGVGGIFYDHVANDWEKDFQFTQALGECFLSTYQQLLTRNKDTAWQALQKQEQSYYRAIYAEFNLLYDRGTSFGLKSGGNVDSIFSSMPPVACW